jgi:hypothetical protein
VLGQLAVVPRTYENADNMELMYNVLESPYIELEAPFTVW